MSSIEATLRRIGTDLAAIGADHALVGGLAVSVRTEPRFTRDVDLAVAVADDATAEAVIGELLQRGYRSLAMVEHEATGRLATARLIGPLGEGTVVDLLLASSGIEPEVVAQADWIEVLDGLVAPVARGLRAEDGDPLGVGPALSGSTTRRSVQRTLTGTVDGIPVAVVMTVGLSGGPRQLHARSDLYGVARVGSPVPIDRIRAALQDQPGVNIGAVGDLTILQPKRGLRLTVDHPPPEEAAWLFDLTARAARAART